MKVVSICFQLHQYTIISAQHVFDSWWHTTTLKIPPIMEKNTDNVLLNQQIYLQKEQKYVCWRLPLPFGAGVLCRVPTERMNLQTVKRIQTFKPRTNQQMRLSLHWSFTEPPTWPRPQLSCPQPLRDSVNLDTTKVLSEKNNNNNKIKKGGEK